MSTIIANTNTPSADQAKAEAEKLNISQATELYFEIANAYQEDFHAWSKPPYWTTDEATALALGKNPKLVNWLTVQPHLEISTFAKEYAALRDLIQRAVTIGKLQAESTPFEYMTWLSPRFPDFPDGIIKKMGC